MNKQEHIEYWIKSASLKWESATILFEKKSFVDCLFYSHLVLEQLLKAHWVKDNEGNMPPKVHNLKFLADQTNLNLTNDQIDFLILMNSYQMESRYADYKFSVYKICTESYTKPLLEKINIIRKWLINQLQ